MRDMDDFDLEQFLDNAGVKMGPLGSSAGDASFKVTDLAMNKGVFVRDIILTPENKAEQEKWHQKQLYRPCSILKTKVLFPQAFMAKTNGQIWDASEEPVESTKFSLREGVMFMMLEEGVVRASMEMPVRALATAQNPSEVETLISDAKKAYVDSRYIKGLAVFGKNEPGGSPYIQGHEHTPSRQHNGPGIFYVLLNRMMCRTIADKHLFEVLQDGQEKQKDLEVLDYRNILRMNQPMPHYVSSSED